MQQFLKKYWFLLLGVVVGALGGYFYWLYVGCESGTCPITSSSLMSSLWGAIIGGLFFSLFQKDAKKNH